MVTRKWIVGATLAVVALASLAVASAGSARPSATIQAALISDVGKFNDKSFNQSQLEGLQRAGKQLGVKTLPLQSNSASDYLPNLTTAVVRKSDIVMAAGYLMADATATVAKKFPNTKFAITDYSIHAAPFADKKGHPLFKNVVGLTYAANEGGCLAGALAAQQAAKMGGDTIGAVGGLKIPPVDIWIAGYRYCAQLVVPKTKVLIGYSQDFVAADKCKTVAEDQIAKGAKVLFQVAGGCGLGVLKAADDAKIWGIGVDKDQYNDAQRVLTSAFKRVDTGIYNTVKSVKDGTYKGGVDVPVDLANGGIGLGKINPSVPKAFIDKTNALKKKIIDGKVKVPTHL